MTTYVHPLTGQIFPLTLDCLASCLFLSRTQQAFRFANCELVGRELRVWNIADAAWFEDQQPQWQAYGRTGVVIRIVDRPVALTPARPKPSTVFKEQPAPRLNY